MQDIFSGRHYQQKRNVIMQLFDVCTKRVYETDGEKKVKWYRIGIMKTTDRGNTYIRLFHQPDVDLHIFKSEAGLPVIQAKD